MFPIICLSDQLNTINNFISSNRLTLGEILHWFSRYGELILPNEEHSIRHGTLNGWTIEVSKQMNVYIWLSQFGFVNVFHFENNNQVVIFRPMSGLPYDRHKKWILENHAQTN